MKRSIISVVTASVALALAGCGSGQYSQTATMPPAVPGASAEFTTEDGYNSVSVRNATLTYPGVEGYKAGSEAPLNIWLFNDTTGEQRVVIKSQGQNSPVFTIPPAGMLNPDVRIKLKSDEDLNNAGAAEVDVEFVGLTTFNLKVPVAPPMAPAPKETVELEESSGGEGH